MIYTVKAGDYLSKIAKEQGFADWRTVYNHPQNADFKRRRPNPNLIYPGDQIFIPDKRLNSTTAPTDQRAKFRIKRAKETLELKLVDFQGNPLANLACQLEIDGVKKEATTNGDGVLKHTIRADLHQARLIVNGVVTTLQIGHLNPMDDAEDEGVSGVQGRLANLGYYRGAVDGQMGDETRSAIRAFRRDNSLVDSADIDQPFKDKLKQKYGS